MAKSTVEAQKINYLIREGKTINEIKLEHKYNASEWYRYSAKAYELNLVEEKRSRKRAEKQPHVSTTSYADVLAILNLNELLANYALCLPIFSTPGEFQQIKNFSTSLPGTEREILKILARMTIDPRLRVLQKRGRFEQFDYFKPFVKLIDAATLCFYRENFISCFLSLAPVVEGVIIRWMGYKESDAKPEFEDIRRFFNNGHMRQPCPTNIHFHEIFSKACSKILNEHFYRPTAGGYAYANFNRHVASHLLNENQFATEENCIRLFILLDMMTEIYLYEEKVADLRFYLKNEDVGSEIGILESTMLLSGYGSAERFLLGDILKLF